MLYGNAWGSAAVPYSLYLHIGIAEDPVFRGCSHRARLLRSEYRAPLSLKRPPSDRCCQILRFHAPFEPSTGSPSIRSPTIYLPFKKNLHKILFHNSVKYYRSLLSELQIKNNRYWTNISWYSICFYSHFFTRCRAVAGRSTRCPVPLP